MGFPRQEHWSILGECCHFLLQGIFLTQGSNPNILHWQEDSSLLSHLGSPHLGVEVFIFYLSPSSNGFLLLLLTVVHSFSPAPSKSLCKSTSETSLAVQWLRFCLPKEGLWVWSLVRQLRSHMPRKPKNQNIKQEYYCNKFIKNLKNGPY